MASDFPVMVQSTFAGGTGDHPASVTMTTKWLGFFSMRRAFLPASTALTLISGFVQYGMLLLPMGIVEFDNLRLMDIDDLDEVKITWENQWWGSRSVRACRQWFPRTGTPRMSSGATEVRRKSIEGDVKLVGDLAGDR
jgi:hypothetical protein